MSGASGKERTSSLLSRGNFFETNRKHGGGRGLNKYGTGFSTVEDGNVTMDPRIREIQEQGLSRNNNLYNQLGESARNLVGNQSAYIQARVNPLEQELTTRQGGLERNIGLRGVAGSSFGNMDLTNFANEKQRVLGDARALATTEGINAAAQMYSQQAQLTNMDNDTAKAMMMQELQALGLGQQQINSMIQAFESQQNRSFQERKAIADTIMQGFGMGKGGMGKGKGGDEKPSLGTGGSGDYSEPPTDSGSGASGKIVCTAMNEAYGFGSYRNRIWLKYAKDHLTKEHQIGYHAIFLPLVKFGFHSGNGVANRIVKKILEHIARHRSVDLRAVMSGGKRDKIGAIYRSILEPVCYLVGCMRK
jgi:hypothetical protein